MVEQQQQSTRLVETNKAVAAGIAAVIAALFTSKLGVAGTLIGTALTAMTITLGAAILKAQIERAQTTLSGLPSTVRGRLSTQQVRVPGRPNAEPNPEPPPPPEPRGGHTAGFLERLRSIPSFLKGLSTTARRRVLVSGALAGLVAIAIALCIITFTEAVAGEPISSFVGTQRESAVETGPRTSVGSLFGGSSQDTDPQNTPQQYVPQQDVPAGEGQDQRVSPAAPQPSGGGQYPEDPVQQPADPAPQDPGQEQPGGTPQDGTPQNGTPPQQQPGAEPVPDVEEPAVPPDQ